MTGLGIRNAQKAGMNDKEQDLHETPCAHCGADTEWSFIDEARTQVEVLCPNCGLLELTKAEFDQAAAELAQPADRE